MTSHRWNMQAAPTALPPLLWRLERAAPDSSVRLWPPRSANSPAASPVAPSSTTTRLASGRRHSSRSTTLLSGQPAVRRASISAELLDITTTIAHIAKQPECMHSLRRACLHGTYANDSPEMQAKSAAHPLRARALALRPAAACQAPHGRPPRRLASPPRPQAQNARRCAAGGGAAVRAQRSAPACPETPWRAAGTQQQSS